ncbi:MAG: zinc metallopeptidase [Chromatiales bacterium]|nr:zinc metallopeptidase [Chromatiales bacterium]
MLLILLLVGLVFLPGWWVQRVMQRYSEPRNRYPGSGGELARHLLDRLGLHDVSVEATDAGDHYDPSARVVRLTPDKLGGRSLTAITVAAHEVGHAHQHATGYAPLAWRTRLVGLAGPAERLGAGLLMLTPVIAIALRSPRLAFAALLVGVLTMLLTTLVHLVTLPVELDASFGRAMPMLEHGGYLQPGDESHARRLLRAAALTYVSASLMSLLNMARWWAILRR